VSAQGGAAPPPRDPFPGDREDGEARGGMRGPSRKARHGHAEQLPPADPSAAPSQSLSASPGSPVTGQRPSPAAVAPSIPSIARPEGSSRVPSPRHQEEPVLARVAAT